MVRSEMLDAAKASFAAAPEVQQCYYVTGEADFMLIMIVPSMAEYEALTKRLFFANNAGIVFAVGAKNGKRAWKYDSKRCVAASPALDRHVVYETFLNAYDPDVFSAPYV